MSIAVEIKKLKNLLLICIICIAFASLSIAFIPLGDFRGVTSQVVIAYLVGVVFWLGTISGYLTLYAINRKRKKLSDKPNKKLRLKPGVFAFFQTPYGKVSDIACGLMLIVLIIMVAVGDNVSQWALFVTFSVFIFAVQIRCILNGKNYTFINFLESRGRKNG